jgi:hypothetical protein
MFSNTNPILIHEFMPRYEVSERHDLEVAAGLDMVYAVVQNMDFSYSLVIRTLFAVRGLPTLFRRRRQDKPLAALGLDLQGLLKSGFVLLGEIPRQEIVLGLIGKFWTTTGCLQKVNVQEFLDFTSPGFAKAVWNFSLQPVSPSRTMLATETRVLCLDENSRRRFRFYWFFVRPFSGWIRMEALRCLKRQAESGGASSHKLIYPDFATKREPQQKSL